MAKKNKVIPLNTSKKVSRKIVKIKQANLIEKKVVSRYKKWQLKIAKLIGVEVADAHECLYKIQYYGGKLKENDVVFNSEQVLFAVLQTINGLAMICTMEAHVKVPTIHGTLTILEKPKEKKKETK